MNTKRDLDVEDGKRTEEEVRFGVYLIGNFFRFSFYQIPGFGKLVSPEIRMTLTRCTWFNI
jgi:hypothetical protein